MASASSVRFYNLNRKYGISIRDANEVCADNNGFIWASSKFGIIRFSEDDYRIYNLPYESVDVISVGLTYNNSKIYAYSNNGQVFIYNEIFDRFDLLVNLNKRLKNPYLGVNKILVDLDNGLWITSSSGLYYYHHDNIKNVLDDHITCSCWYNEKKICYTIDGGIFLLETNTFKSEAFYLSPKEEDFSVSELFYDNVKKELWVGTSSHGLYCVKEKDGSIEKSVVKDIPNQPVLAIEANSDATLLVGIDGQGIWEINKQSKEVLNIYKEDIDNAYSLKGNGVYDIYCDNKKRVWICTVNGGVSFFEQESPVIQNIKHVTNNQNSLVNNDINRVLEDEGGNIWFATNNGISRWNVSRNEWCSFYHNKKEHAQVFLSLCEDDKGRIWAGTYSSGIYVLDRESGAELAHYSQDDPNGAFNSNFVFELYKDSEGDVWIGDVTGPLVYYQSDKDTFITIGGLAVNDIVEYEKGQMLLGTTFGVLLLNKYTGDFQGLINGVIVNDISIVDSSIWVSTSGEGVIQYDMNSKSSVKFKIGSGLTSNFVNSIGSSDDYLWMGTENGLCRFNQKSNSMLTFWPLEISNIPFNLNSYSRLKNGKMIWGTNNGAFLFDPDSIRTFTPQGRIFYQDLTIAGRSIRDSSVYDLKKPLDNLDALTLKYDQNTITIELLPIGISQPGSKFSWKLEGLDNDWVPVTDNRVLTYTNIPSGDFALKIRMYNNSLDRILDERSITIHKIPPLWEQWWFRLFLLVFGVTLVLIFFIYYIDRLKKKHSEEKIRFFTNTAHDIRTSLTLINGPIEELHKETNLSDRALYFLNLVTEQAQRLSAFVNQLMDFQKVDVGKETMNLAVLDIVKIVSERVMMFNSYAPKKDIKLVLKTNQSCYLTAIDERLIEKVIDNLISNAVKYSHDNGKVEISIKCSPNKWILEVRDYGIGITKKAQKQLFKEFYRGENAINSKIVGSGIGLLLIKNYVSLHGGVISCNSQDKVGSTFTVEIPYKNVSGIDLNDKKKSIKYNSSIAPDAEQVVITEQKQDGSDSRMKVLIVEDHHDLKEFLSSTLQNHYKILLAEDGIVAWDIIQKNSPDLVVSDIMMPNMDGFELCKRIKSTYETSHIPVILLTALTKKSEKLYGLGLGADDYLTKPFDITLLQQRISTIIKNRKVVKDKALKMIKLNNEEPGSIIKNELNDQFVKKMVEVVRSNISNANFNKDNFASEMNVSPSLLYKKVKALTDQSPTDFIKSIRMDCALKLIQEQKYTITEVSELSGFSSVGYFSTVFKKYYKKSPTELLI